MAGTPQIITVDQARERRYSECSMCPRSTENGCFRAVRIELLDARGRRLDEVMLPNEMFCSEACIRTAARAIMDEINSDTDPDLLTDYKKWKGHVGNISVGFAKIGLVPSADE